MTDSSKNSLTFKPEEYWKNLVGTEMSLKEVGWSNWTEAYNFYRYKLSSEQIADYLKQYKVLKDNADVLELGCGVGFWTNFLVKNYKNFSYLGADISEKAIEQLSQKYASQENVSFQNADIGNPAFAKELNKKFDFIFAFEVLLHIVNDENFENAWKNISALLENNGKIFISDPIYVYPYHLAFNGNEACRVRSVEYLEEVLKRNNLKIEGIHARTFLLDNNTDFKHKLSFRLWNKFFSYYNQLLSVQSESLGTVLGKTAYYFDKTFCRFSKYGHSCKLFVISKS